MYVRNVRMCKIPEDLANYFTSVSGLQWKYSSCKDNNVEVNEKKLSELGEEKCKDLFSEITDKFDNADFTTFAIWKTFRNSSIYESYSQNSHRNIK